MTLIFNFPVSFQGIFLIKKVPSKRGRLKKLIVFHLWCLNLSTDENVYIFFVAYQQAFQEVSLSCETYGAISDPEKKQSLSTVYKNM